MSRLLLPLAYRAAWVTCWLLVGYLPAAHATDRIALVVGNQSYPGAPLDNPASDAKSIAAALQERGFQVLLLVDATRAAMLDAISATRERLRGKNAVALFYYSGHAFQLEWRNFLVPIDARLGSTRDVPSQTIDLSAVLEALKQAGTRMNIVVLDACRDNPFGSTGRGLGLTQMDTPWGTYLAYSTAPGNVAEDNTAGPGNSLYTYHLIQEIRKPKARIEDVFKRVRLQVRERTAGRQIPWDATSLEDEFLFDDGLQTAVTPDAAAKERAFAVEKASWDRIANSTNAEALYQFLKEYPSGSYSELAQARLELLQAPRALPQRGPDGLVPGDWRSRYREGDVSEFVFKDGLTGVTTVKASTRIAVGAGDAVVGLGNGMASTRTLRGELIVEDGFGSYDPPWVVVPAGGFQAGNRASGRSILIRRDGNKGWLDSESRVVGRETITVPAGTFDAWKVEVNGMFDNGTRRKLTMWFDPAWGYAVKLMSETRTRNGVLDLTIREMVSRKRVN